MIRKEMRSKNALIEKIVEYGFSRPAAKRFLEQNTEEEIENALKAVDIQVSKGQVKNTKAMLKTAIQEKWKLDVYRVKKKAA